MKQLEIPCIACMVDFSDLSRDGLDIGMALARRFSSELLVFHAVNLPGDRITGSDYSVSKPIQAKQKEEARRRLKNWTTGFPAASVLITDGDPVEDLREAAAHCRMGLVVAPSSGGSGLRRVFAGTLVERLVRRIHVPVLVTRPAAPKKWDGEVPIRQVAAGVRLDGESEECLLRCACRIAGCMDARLHVLHVLESPPDVEAGSYERNQRLVIENMGRRLMRAAWENRMDPDRVVSAVLTGTPGDVFTRYIRDAGIDLTIVGVRRIGKFRKNLIGSTTEYLLRYAPGMVLTLPVDEPENCV